jgi:virginiamycin B lyase
MTSRSARALGAAFAALVATAACASAAFAQTVRYYQLPARSGPHDVAPAPDGTVWYTAQRSGHLGRLDPKTGQVEEIPLGRGSAPHGVIVGPDGAAWVTDSGQNAIVRVDPKTKAVKVFALPDGTPYANLNTAAFDGNGVLWWTGQAGYYGSVDPRTGTVRVVDAPQGRGPYGITATPKGEIYYVSLAGSHLARIDTATGAATVIEPPTPRQGARRVWSDSKGRLWISEWISGQVSMYDPAARQWKAWKPAERAQMYSVYVDERDKVWLTEWSSNAILRFDPQTEKFERFPSDKPNAQVRQMLGRPGEAWGAESGTDRLVVISTR